MRATEKGDDYQMRRRRLGKVRVWTLLLILVLLALVVYAVQAFVYGPLPGRTALSSFRSRAQGVKALRWDLTVHQVSLRLPLGSLEGDVTLVQLAQAPDKRLVHLVQAGGPGQRFWEGAKLMASGGKSYLYVAPLDTYVKLPGEMAWPTFELMRDVNEITNAATRPEAKVRRLPATGGIGGRSYRLEVRTPKLRGLVVMSFFGAETMKVNVFDTTGTKKKAECRIDLKPIIKPEEIFFEPRPGAHIVSPSLEELRGLSGG